MKKISLQAATALFSGVNKNLSSNTKTKNNALYLFNNKIAWIENKRLYINFCGWDSQTTKDRLDAVMDYLENNNIIHEIIKFCTKKGQLKMQVYDLKTGKKVFHDIDCNKTYLIACL